MAASERAELRGEACELRHGSSEETMHPVLSFAPATRRHLVSIVVLASALAAAVSGCQTAPNVERVFVTSSSSGGRSGAFRGTDASGGRVRDARLLE